MSRSRGADSETGHNCMRSTAHADRKPERTDSEDRKGKSRGNYNSKLGSVVQKWEEEL